jgi:hypothetical protein
MMKCKKRVTIDTRVTAATWLRTSLAVVGIAAMLGSVSPAMASGISRRASVHKRKPKPLKETPVQKATTKMLENFAAQILADYHQTRGAPMCQPGVGWGNSFPNDEGVAGFYVSATYPLAEGSGPSEQGSPPNCKSGEYGYGLHTDITVPGAKLVPLPPEAVRESAPPSKINPSDVNYVDISGLMSSSKACESRHAVYGAPFYDFTAHGNGGDGSRHQKHQWDVSLGIDTLEGGGITVWNYTTGTGDLNKGNKTPYSSLNMAELQALRGLTQTILYNAKQSIPTSITGAAEFPFPRSEAFPFVNPFTSGGSC